MSYTRNHLEKFLNKDIIFCSSFIPVKSKAETIYYVMDKNKNKFLIRQINNKYKLLKTYNSDIMINNKLFKNTLKNMREFELRRGIKTGG